MTDSISKIEGQIAENNTYCDNLNTSFQILLGSYDQNISDIQNELQITSNNLNNNMDLFQANVKNRILGIETSVSDLGVQMSSYIDETVRDQIDAHPQWQIYQAAIRKIQDAFIVNNREMVTLAESIKSTENAQLSMTKKFGEYTDLTSKVQGYQTSLDNYRTQLTKNNTSLQTVYTKLTTIENSVESATVSASRIQTIEASLQDIASSITQTNTTVNALITDISTLQSQISLLTVYMLANMVSLVTSDDTLKLNTFTEQANNAINNDVTADTLIATISNLLSVAQNSNGDVTPNTDLLLPSVQYINSGSQLKTTTGFNTGSATI